MSETIRPRAAAGDLRPAVAVPPYVSVIVPVFEEEENLEPLYRDLVAAFRPEPWTYELILVDDGSRDGSFQVLSRLAADDPLVRVIRLRRNCGQTAAMAAGFDHARGQVIVPLDADRQNDPADIPLLVRKLEEGFDVVSGWRRHRQDPGVTRRLPSWIANSLISSITGIYLHDYGCSLKAYRAEILKQVRLYGEMHRLIPAYAALEGARVTELPVRHHPRRAGRSKYGLSRTLKVVLDLLVVKFLGTYGTRPIHFFGAAGAALCAGGILSGAWALYDRLVRGIFVHRNPLILLAVFLFLAGLQLVMMGLLAEIAIRTYHEAVGRGTYPVRERLNIDGDAASDA
jgi:glycosyltransferase involved in cell wall biosynthesis